MTSISDFQIIVVKDGHEFYDDMTDTTHVVSEGNAVQQGRRIFMVQKDYDGLKARLGESPE